MKISNSKEVDTFCWEHRNNGCDGIKGGLIDEHGLTVNTAWRDKVTGEEIKVEYEVTDDDIRAMWINAGGTFHGPITETATMTEERIIKFIRGLL
ncbi:MAG: hypothetical protein KAR42_14685 [candidate division Zixibacteria bacterium]|nr:hypothetical protein [candidate division Zixibacteria bacterium]